jgi:hypothetical protein
MRMLCRGKNEPNAQLCLAFNQETKDGRDMEVYSELLSEAIDSVIHVKEEAEIDSFLKGSQMSFLSDTISGLDDFELIDFLVIE